MLLITLFNRKIRIYILFIIFSIRFSYKNNKIFNKIIGLGFSKLNKLFFKIFASKTFIIIFSLFLIAFYR